MRSLRVTGHGVDLGESLRSRVEERMSATLAKYMDTHMKDSCAGHVTLRRDGTAFRTDCVLHLVSGLTIEAASSAHDPRASFEQTADRLETRLRRYKHRLKEHATGPGDAAVEAAYAVFAAPEDDDPEPEVDGDAHPPIVAESTRTLERRTVGEAVTALDMTGSPVVVFVHAGTGRVNVVYRRSDGAIGWVDPPTSGA
ncbi:ribosome-associated translation inhibitor RaiA [Methylobacterium sp. NEAU 140]|uniref:ribosome hibernation-promoting factor, HPF/YfiA family n=1 Tax=Methylobacterium sp. NEAU 140 TaxID=3064945 RepID=UPI0027329BC0|nr:ribosome-associated translation inhibitor RaiA [Methylobacterium sp. NEAU 140]MDP4021077.1 ribosome-associated translation inhibitor RaiA [Methylobacterium sp. NEAU 140]